MKLCIVAHAPLASALKAVVQEITGTVNLLSVDLFGDQSPEVLSKEIAKMHEAAALETWVYFVDLLGGSPMQGLLPIFLKEDVRVIAGVNLPMLLAALKWRTREDVDQWLKHADNYGIKEISSSVKAAHAKIQVGAGDTNARD
mgnify:CR=1 FL=1